MPTKRTPIDRHILTEVSDAVIETLLTGETTAHDLELVRLRCTVLAGKRPDAWEQVSAAFLDAYIADNVGHRPWAWWALDAPETRRRVGGIGTPQHECLAVAPSYRFGIPCAWLSDCEAQYYRGELGDIDGTRLHPEGLAEDFAGVDMNPADPPRYESEAAFLRRHKLLSSTERRRLRKTHYARETVIVASDHIWDSPWDKKRGSRKPRGCDVVVADPLDPVTDYAMRVLLSSEKKEVAS